jgi:long-chain acyl-CoA synthetase
VNVADQLRANAARLRDKTALAFQDTHIAYADLDARVDRVAAAFQGLGLGSGDRVALLLANSVHFVEALYGAWRAGLVAVPINPTFTTEEVVHIVGDSGARAIVAAEPFAAVLQGVRETVLSLEEVIVAGASGPPVGTQSWGAFVGTGGQLQPDGLERDALALLQYTSGTTGRPKGTMLSHGNLIANHAQVGHTRIRVEEGDTVLCVLPLFHIYALNVALAFPLSRGATVLLVERFDPVQTLNAIQAHRVSVVVGAPPMYVAWLNTPGVETFDLASVRFAVSGAAPLAPRVLQRFRSELGIAIWEGYGLTETAPVLTTTAMGHEPIPGSVGKPVPDVELRLCDEAGNLAERGDPGEVVVRGPNVFAGYWLDAAATAEVLSDDGWFHTGDIGYTDDDGNLYLIDRKKDLIIVSGFNVYPREVEDVLLRHPKVADVAVIGTPHPYSGEAVKAVVSLVAGEEASDEELIAHCQRSLARFKCPEVIELVDELPTLSSGKVSRRRLREEPS